MQQSGNLKVINTIKILVDGTTVMDYDRFLTECCCRNPKNNSTAHPATSFAGTYDDIDMFFVAGILYVITFDVAGVPLK